MQRAAADIESHRAARLFALMLAVFLGGGLLASSETLLVPRLKLLLGLDYAQALLVQLLYYLGYLLFALPATILTARVGLMRAVRIALAVMAAGCVAVAEAQSSLAFGALLVALLLLSSGVTVLQVACNGAMATLGPRDRATARFTLLQGFNALGTVLGPLVGAWFLLGSGSGAVARIPFLAFAAGFALLATAFAVYRDLLPHPGAAGAPTLARLRAVLRAPRTMHGTVAIFAYVGAEVTIGALAVSYLMLPDRLHAGAVAAGRLVSLYWTSAMIGRFAGAWALRRWPVARLLGLASVAAIACVAAAVVFGGIAGSIALLSVGFANAIMFPTIYGLAMPPEAEDVPTASMLLCMAVVGGAIVPMATGLAADRFGLVAAFALPAACYAVILHFAWREAS
jgi:FHS family L-fucose permease-like MFS transporter